VFESLVERKIWRKKCGRTGLMIESGGKLVFILYS